MFLSVFFIRMSIFICFVDKATWKWHCYSLYFVHMLSTQVSSYSSFNKYDFTKLWIAYIPGQNILLPTKFWKIYRIVSYSQFCCYKNQSNIFQKRSFRAFKYRVTYWHRSKNVSRNHKKSKFRYFRNPIFLYWSFCSIMNILCWL